MGDETGKSDVRFERRRFPRIDAKYVISYKELFDVNVKFDLSQTKNIGEGGILFTSDKIYQKGAILELKIRFPDFSDFVTLKGKVVDSKSIGKGIMTDTRVSFIDTEEKVKEAIKKIVEANLAFNKKIN